MHKEVGKPGEIEQNGPGNRPQTLGKDMEGQGPAADPGYQVRERSLGQNLGSPGAELFSVWAIKPSIHQIDCLFFLGP